MEEPSTEDSFMSDNISDDIPMSVHSTPKSTATSSPALTIASPTGSESSVREVNSWHYSFDIPWSKMPSSTRKLFDTDDEDHGVWPICGKSLQMVAKHIVQNKMERAMSRLPQTMWRKSSLCSPPPPLSSSSPHSSSPSHLPLLEEGCLSPPPAAATAVFLLLIIIRGGR
ncbi:hypothetical protein D5F01_LYC23640 [Larimichthys crocea]|uniref:Uncharacterized protein n=1 Tax=Larimichthys crocea TaxID=215358 RepID=A0A6G0HI69_LARCR|nr:hypothetical protein D5F01_LYC23640 [Larimichthys crocea]